MARTPEVQIFLRPKGKVEDDFKNMPRTTTDLVLKWYRIFVQINESRMDDSTIAKYNNDINEFIKEQKILMDHLKNFKTHIGALVPMKEMELKYYKNFTEFL